MKITQQKLFILWIVLLTGLYNIILFLVKACTSILIFSNIFWISYSFIMISPLLIIGCSFLKQFQKKDTFAITISYLKLGICYFLIQIVVGTIFMFFPKCKVTIGLLVQLPILVVFIIFLVILAMSTKHINDNLEVQKQKVQFLSLLQVKLKTEQNVAQNKDLKKKIGELIEIVKYSDYNSIPETHDVEEKILLKVDMLSRYEDIKKEEIIEEIKVLLMERKNMILLLKR